MIHILKIAPQYYKDVEQEIKTFEVRKNDRNFKVRVYIILAEYESVKYTGRIYTGRIKYILDDPEYVKDGFVIFGFYRVATKQLLTDHESCDAILALLAPLLREGLADEVIRIARGER